MIDDVLKEIREAEAQADEIVSEAQNKAKQIVQQAEIDAEKQKKATIKTQKARCKAECPCSGQHR